MVTYFKISLGIFLAIGCSLEVINWLWLFTSAENSGERFPEASKFRKGYSLAYENTSRIPRESCVWCSHEALQNFRSPPVAIGCPTRSGSGLCDSFPGGVHSSIFTFNLRRLLSPRLCWYRTPTEGTNSKWIDEADTGRDGPHAVLHGKIFSTSWRAPGFWNTGLGHRATVLVSKISARFV